MSFYWFNRKELLKKSHDKYHKEGGKKSKKILSRKQRKDKTKRETQVQIDVCRRKK